MTGENREYGGSKQFSVFWGFFGFFLRLIGLGAIFQLVAQLLAF